jgi:lysozyme
MNKRKLLRIIVICLSLTVAAYLLFTFRYLIYRTVVPTFQDYRASKIPSGYTMHGIDVSLYQGRINWDKLGKINKTIPVNFVIIRATMGALGEDKEFPRNWRAAKKKKLIRGAYHYYNPNVTSTLQAENFILTVDLKPGDLPPILDIEKVSTIQDLEALRRGIRNWLERIEKHYGVKPILYTGSNFYNAYLKGYFDEYPLWIANYRRVNNPLRSDWIIWQFTEKGTIDGIRGFVDMDVFYGSRREMERLLIED